MKLYVHPKRTKEWIARLRQDESPTVSGEWFVSEKVSNTCWVRVLYLVGIREKSERNGAGACVAGAPCGKRKTGRDIFCARRGESEEVGGEKLRAPRHSVDVGTSLRVPSSVER